MNSLKDFQNEIKLLLIIVVVSILLIGVGILVSSIQKETPSQVVERQIIQIPEEAEINLQFPHNPCEPEQIPVYEGGVFSSCITLTESLSDDTSDWQTYTNEEFGFEFRYPEDWTRDFGDSTSNEVEIYDGILVGDILNEYARFRVNVREVSKTISDIWDPESQIGSSIKEIGGIKAVVQAIEDGRGDTVQYTLLANNNFYQIQTTIFNLSNLDLPPEPPDYREIFNQILSTFRFIEQSEIEWNWNLLGCGSHAPCSYQVSSTDSADSYSCRGKRDAGSETGEITPTSTTDPRTTTDFICEKEAVGYTKQVLMASHSPPSCYSNQKVSSSRLLT